jgi:hypothetical protein
MRIGWLAWVAGAGCVHIPADYVGALALELPSTAASFPCVSTEERGEVTLTREFDLETSQCVITSRWSGEVIDLPGIRAAVEAEAARYDRSPEAVRRVALQQLDFAISGAWLSTATGERLPVAVESKVQITADAVEGALLSQITNDTADFDWFAGSMFRATEAGPTRNRNSYEEGSNPFLDALNTAYAAGEPFTGAVELEVRVDAAQVDLVGAVGDLSLAVDARVAIGATFWTALP